MQMLLSKTRLLHCARISRHHSGVELRRVGLNVAVQSGWSDFSGVITPIFLSERSSVTEKERVKAGRVAAAGTEMYRKTNWKCLISQKKKKNFDSFMCSLEN